MTFLKELMPDEFFSKISDSDLEFIRQRACGQSLEQMTKEWREIAAHEYEVDIVGDLKGYLRKGLDHLVKNYGLT